MSFRQHGCRTGPRARCVSTFSVAAGLLLLVCMPVATAAPRELQGLTRIELNGPNITGSVSFEGNPWQGYFVPQQGGRVTINPYIPGNNADKVIRVYVGLDYQPSPQTNDWRAVAIGTGDYEFWYPGKINYVFPNTTYYVSVVDSIILPAAFTIQFNFEPMPPVTVQALKVGDLPVPGRVDEGQYTYYTATPSAEGNLKVSLQVTSGAATVVANLGSYATLGNQQWSAKCDATSGQNECSLEAMYIRANQEVFISVWGRMGRNDGDDDRDQAVDRYYLSVAAAGSS